MNLIYGALGAVLIGTTGLAWHYGRELRAANAYEARIKAELATCKAALVTAEQATQDWKFKYDTDMKAKDDSYAELSQKQSDSAKAANRKQFDAGLRYGRAMCRNPPANEPRGVPEREQDFAVFIDHPAN